MTLTLIDDFLAVLPPSERDNIVVFGVAAFELNGVPLGRAVADLYLFVSDETFARLKGTFPEETKQGNPDVQHVLRPCRNVEILKRNPGVTFDTVYRRARVVPAARGLRVASVVDLVIWKHAQGRDKDIADLDDAGKSLASRLLGKG